MKTILGQLMGSSRDPLAGILRQGEGAGGGGGGAGAAGAGAGAAGAGAGGAAGAAGAAGNGTGAAAGAAGAGAAGGAAGDSGGTGDGGAAAGGQQKPWYDARQWSDPTLRDHLVKSGYHNGTADEALERALRGDLSATAKLGKPPGSLIDAPAADQPITDWLKANGKAFALPDSVEKYELKVPENLPEGTPIDDALMAEYKAFAFESGMPPALAQANVDAYARMTGAKITAMAAAAATAEANMDKELKASWGVNFEANQQKAMLAFQALAAEMKLTPEVSQLLAVKLNKDTGDATLMKFFHHIAGKMGEDTLAIPRGGNAPALQLADAQQRKAEIMAQHTGDMAQANKAGNQARVKQLQDELKGLNIIIGQHGGG
jgi:hypothetical protein